MPRAGSPDLTEMLTIEEDEPFILHPGEFVLGQTHEFVELPNDIVSRLEGKSSLGRLGLLIHSTAGFVERPLSSLPVSDDAGRVAPVSRANMASISDKLAGNGYEKRGASGG